MSQYCEWNQVEICVFSSFCVHEKSARGKLVAFNVGHEFLMAAHKERTILSERKPIGDKWKGKVISRSHYCCPKSHATRLMIAACHLLLNVRSGQWALNRTEWIIYRQSLCECLFSCFMRLGASNHIARQEANSRKHTKFNWNGVFSVHALYQQLDDLEYFGCSWLNIDHALQSYTH